MNNVLIAKATHLRTIHFGLVTVLLLVSYLLYSGWETRGDILKEIESLKSLLRLAQEANTDSAALRDSHPDWFAELEEDLRKDMETQLGIEVLWGEQPGSGMLIPGTSCPKAASSKYVSVRTANPFVPQGDLRLKYIREYIENAVWNVSYADRISVDKESIKRWIPSYFLIPDVKSVKILGIDASDPELTSGPFKGEVMLEAPDRASAATMKTTGVGRTTCKAIGIEYYTKSHYLRFDKNLFTDSYPTVTARWSEVKNKNIQQIERAFSPTAGLYARTSDVDLVGVRVSAKHIGVLGPLLILAFLTYLYLHLQHLFVMACRMTIQEGVPRIKLGAVSPWIGLMDLPLPRIASFLTISIAPALVVGLTLRFFSDTRGSLLYLLVSYAAVIGLLTFQKARTSMNLEIAFD